MPVRRLSICSLEVLATLVVSILVSTSSAAEPAFSRAVGDPTLAWGPCPEFLPAGCRIAVLHGDPAQPGSDVFFQIPGSTDLPKHWHGSAERMVLVTGKLSVTYDGQAAVVLEPGMYAYGPPKLAHHGRCLSSEPCTLFIAFVGPLDAFAGAPAAAP